MAEFLVKLGDRKRMTFNGKDFRVDEYEWIPDRAGGEIGTLTMKLVPDDLPYEFPNEYKTLTIPGVIETSGLRGLHILLSNSAGLL